MKSLNDPYESLPLVDTSELKHNSNLNKELQKLDKLWEEQPENEKTLNNRELLDKKKALLSRLYSNESATLQIKDKLMSLFGDHFGILSLSRSNSNLLMWSHYTNSMKGFVIGFDRDNEMFKRPTPNGQPTEPRVVTYSDVRKSYKALSNKDHYSILTSKPLDWAYEQEERVCMSFMPPQFKTEYKDDFGSDIYLIPFPNNAILSIYIGCNASRKTKEAIYESIQKNHIKCKVYETSPSMTHYQLQFKEILLPLAS
ncbi:DUF2971 domain-containing protein [Vibrio ezurae]|nr:DUF2971 domain-containing protein [Vibrio ezurae]